MTAPALRAALARTTEDLARVLSEGSGSLSIAAIAQERARIPVSYTHLTLPTSDLV